MRLDVWTFGKTGGVSSDEIDSGGGDLKFYQIARRMLEFEKKTYYKPTKLLDSIKQIMCVKSKCTWCGR